MFDGVTAFTLYDTYGFPLDLTQDALRPRGIGVDIASFTDAMERQRATARASWAGSGEAADRDGLVHRARKNRPDRVSGLRYRERRGHSIGAGARRQGSSKRSDAGEAGSIVLNQTPFYGESGGQVGDTGTMTAEGVRFRVTDTQKKVGDVFVHTGVLEEGTLALGAALVLDGRPWASQRHPPESFRHASAA